MRNDPWFRIQQLVLATVCWMASVSAHAASPLDGFPLVLEPLELPVLGLDANFGSALSVSGDTLLVGAPGQWLTGTKTGAVYVYEYDRVRSRWRLDQEIFPPQPISGSMAFGKAVTIDENTAMIGAPAALDSTGVAAGKVFVYERDTAGWQLVTSFERLPYPNPSGYKTERKFGDAVALSGDLAIVGAPSNPVKHNACSIGEHMRETGAAYFYSRSGGSWFLNQRLPSEADLCQRQRYGRYSSEVAATEGRLFVGQPNYDYFYTWACPNGNDGRVRMFAGGAQVGGDITIEAGGDILDPGGSLCDPNNNHRHAFGAGIAARWIGDQLYLLAGAPRSNIAGWDRGKTYLLRRTPSQPGGWDLVMSKIGEPSTGSGSAVALGDRYALIGAPAGMGEVLIFDHIDGSPSPTDFVRLSPNITDEAFGSSVALHATHAIIGAPGHVGPSASAEGLVYVTRLPNPAVIEYRFDHQGSFSIQRVENRAEDDHDGVMVGELEQVMGALGNAMQAHGSGAVEVEQSELIDFPAGLTIEAFVRRDSTDTSDGIVSRWSKAEPQLKLYFLGDRLYFTATDALGTERTVSYLPQNETYLGEWVHVAATYDGAGRLRLFWNGQPVSLLEGVGTRLAVSTAPMRVGDLGPNVSNSGFHGALDEVRIWDRVLGDEEIILPLRPKLLVLRYDSADPMIFDPGEVTGSLIEALADHSGFVRQELVGWIDPGTLPPQHPAGGVDLAAIYAQYGICELASRGELHEVWLWGGGDDAGFPEWAVNGPWREAYNGNVQPMPPCDIQFNLMGFNFTRSLALALHSVGHRLELTFRHFWGAYWDYFDGQYHRYPPAPPVQPPPAPYGNHCGNVHYPPNTGNEYEFDNRTAVGSDCDHWVAGDLGSAPQETPVSCETWIGPDCLCSGADCEQELYLRWWLDHLPGPFNTHGMDGLRTHNWWSTFAE